LFIFSVDWKGAQLIPYTLIISDVWWGKKRKELIHIYDTEEIKNSSVGLVEDHKATEIGHLKVKVKFTPEQATKAKRGSRGIALLFL